MDIRNTPLRRTGIAIGVFAALGLLGTGCSAMQNGASNVPTTSNSPAPLGSVLPAPRTGSSGASSTDTPSTSGQATQHSQDSGKAPANGASEGGSTPGQCYSKDLKLSISKATGSAGHTEANLLFTNSSSHSCTMRGFPGVSYVNGDSGHQVGSPAQWVGAKGPLLTLHPHQVASAAVREADVGVYGAKCRPVHVRGLRVYPPHNKAAMYVPAPGTGCANAAIAQLQVRSTAKGSGN
ncbi:MAG: DUF4232 domain-containing protein [Sciscionella sp.]